MKIKRFYRRFLFLLLLVQIPSVAFCQELVDILYGGANGGVVGKLPGQYNVTPNGQFCYDIPLSVPCGIGGMAPKLSIAYNSGNGNGLLEFGFDLKGLSTISRAPRNLYNDGISVSTVYEVTDRCFTGHEYIDGFSMINMDGRIYSPYLGRFISPDPFVQAPDNSQSLNRYAYCLNNPLALTDPSGYHWTGDLFCAMVGIAVGFETCGLGVGAAGASSALASCLLNGANLWQTAKSTIVGGFWGAASGVMNCEIGDYADDFWLSTALHSVSDGATEAMQGGHFEHGFFTGMVSSMGGQGIARYGDHLSLEAQVAASSVLGGTVSAIGGGKFASGAMTAAFQMMYNEQLHRGPYMRDLEEIDKIYRQTMSDYPLPQGLYRDLGLPEYDNGCAMRMSYALNKSGVLKIPYIKGQTQKGNDGNYYFMFAKDMDAWLSGRRVWGNPRIYKSPTKYILMNGVVSQSGFGGTVSGHIEYFYNGYDGHMNKKGGAKWYYDNYSSTEPFITRLWKHGR